MCGIAGWIEKDCNMTERGKALKAMSETLERRGPDENGIYINGDTALIHRRLAVIDRENGKQPMSARHGDCTYVIVYNGELYNSAELREELKADGFHFRGHSDTEVVLKSFIKYGDKCGERLNGIFAFAVFSTRDRSLFLCRDRIGVKPLFYSEYSGGLVFGSEIKALLKSGAVRPRIDEQGLNEIFFLGTRFLLTDAVERQLVSDVPLCMLLSGGLDSSVIVKVASQYNRARKLGRVNTFSVEYRDNDKYFQTSKFQPNRDAEYIKLMSKNAGSNHTEIIIENTLLADALYDSVLARDLPGYVDVDSSLLLFCGEIKKDFTVALSGECADELFGGYPWYFNSDILFQDCFPWSRSQEIRRFILKDGILPRGEEYVRQRYLDTISLAPKLPSDSFENRRMREMFFLNFYWFMQCLLERKDRCSMYSGLEVRVPFCDYRLVEYAYNMPWELKAFGGREKGIVRKAFEDLLPEEITWRKKSPYPKTHNPKYFEECAERVRKILMNKNALTDLLDKKAVESIIEHPEKIIEPWYGQLMKAPQILAYIVELDFWFEKYKVEIFA